MFKTHFTSVDVVFFVCIIPFVVYVTGNMVFFVSVIAVVDVTCGVVFVVGVIAAIIYVALGLYMLVQQQ